MSIVPSTSPSMVKSSRLWICPLTTKLSPRTDFPAGDSIPADRVANIRSSLSNFWLAVRSAPSSGMGLNGLPRQRPLPSDSRGDLIFQAIKLNEVTFVSLNGSGVLPNVANVVNASRQDIEIAILNRLQRGDFQFSETGDVLQRDPFRLAKGRHAPTIQPRGSHSKPPDRISTVKTIHCR